MYSPLYALIVIALYFVLKDLWSQWREKKQSKDMEKISPYQENYDSIAYSHTEFNAPKNKPTNQELFIYDSKKAYCYPTLNLLNKDVNEVNQQVDIREQKKAKERINEVFNFFGIEISDIEVSNDSNFSLYEITLGSNKDIRKVRLIEDDITLSLAASGVRVLAPIPGKEKVGIEVPNSGSAVVSLKSLLGSKVIKESQKELPCAIGMTFNNEVFTFDIAELPHLLIAGHGGIGKTMIINAILASLLFKKKPDELKIIIADPKKVTYTMYNSLTNHFLAKLPEDNCDPVISDVNKAIPMLNSLCKLMDMRYKLLKKEKVSNIKEYNRKVKGQDSIPDNMRIMPYIVVIIDEFGDFMLTAGKEFELPIARLAHKAHVVGIHLIIVTHRHILHAVSNEIKSNFHARLAFKTNDYVDSKQILGYSGAQYLYSGTDMLFSDGGEPIRVKCANVEVEEIERIIRYIAGQDWCYNSFDLPVPD